MGLGAGEASEENSEGHTGVDLNAWQAPFGDVDRGEPVWSVADGVVASVGYSDSWLGVVVVECEEDDGTRVWFRYAHLDKDSIDVQVGDRVGPDYRGTSDQRWTGDAATRKPSYP